MISWAWAYLSKALHIDTLFPKPLVLEAFTYEKLEAWFQDLAHRGGENFVFRQIDNGLLLTPPVPMAREDSEGKAKITDFLPRLAAYSRGIPGVAHIIWRYSLRLAEIQKKPLDKTEDAPEMAFHQIIWV